MHFFIALSTTSILRNVTWITHKCSLIVLQLTKIEKVGQTTHSEVVQCRQEREAGLSIHFHYEETSISNHFTTAYNILLIIIEEEDDHSILSYV